MRRGTKKCILLLLAILLLCLLAWRLTPHTFEEMTASDRDEITSLAGVVSLSGVRDGRAYTESYALQNVTPEDTAFEGVLMLLNSTRYREDFRNLPGGFPQSPAVAHRVGQRRQSLRRPGRFAHAGLGSIRRRVLQPQPFRQADRRQPAASRRLPDLPPGGSQASELACHLSGKQRRKGLNIHPEAPLVRT